MLFFATKSVLRSRGLLLIGYYSFSYSSSSVINSSALLLSTRVVPISILHRAAAASVAMAITAIVALHDDEINALFFTLTLAIVYHR